MHTQERISSFTLEPDIRLTDEELEYLSLRIVPVEPEEDDDTHTTAPLPPEAGDDAYDTWLEVQLEAADLWAAEQGLEVTNG